MEKIELDGNRADRNKWTWTGLNTARARDINQVFENMADYWPLTERQAYYRLISSGLTKQPHWYQHGNVDFDQVDIYKALGRTLKWMRIDGILPWKALIDEHRIITRKVGYPDINDFIDEELDYFLEGYRKCLAQAQKNYIEVWIEKAALLHIVKPVADTFCRRVVCCKGYNSITFQADFYQRATNAIKTGQQPVVLYFGDFDPSGVNMLHAAMQTIEDELDLGGVDYYRCGINPEHFKDLQAAPVPIKPKEPRAREFIRRYGTTAYELDAFHPEQLKQLVFDSIMAHSDMKVIEEHLEEEKTEAGHLESIKEAVRKTVREML